MTRDLMRGAVAGLAATGAMSATMAVDRLVGPMDDEPPPREITRNQAGALGLRGRASGPGFEAAWVAQHFAYGSAAGAAYEVAWRRLGLPEPWASGPLFGAAIWAASYLGWGPLSGLYPPPDEDEPGRAGMIAVHHLVYGTALAIAARALRGDGSSTDPQTTRPIDSREAGMPRPLGEQVVVLTGASSGIGREAARLLGRKGAAVVLAARDEEALREVAAEVEMAGGRALVVPTDVADWAQVQRLARAAVDAFGRIDTWVNDAGIALGGTVEATEVDEIERIFRVNFMGQVHGIKAALPFMRRQGAGAFINVGSVAGVRSFPLQTIYSSTKHAVKALSEGLRLELGCEPGDYHVTLIAPAAINTPLFRQARSKMGRSLEPPAPVYDPSVVAESIVFAAEHPRRDIFVGGGAKMFDVLERISPGLTDWLMTRNDLIFKEQVSDVPAPGPGNLFQHPEGPRPVRGPHADKAHATSLYTKVFEWHPVLKPVALGVAALGIVALIRGATRPRRGRIEAAVHEAVESLT